MVYGQHGVGKSRFAAGAEKPIFIQTEDGLGEIGCDRFPLAESFGAVKESLADLLTEDHAYRTVVIDSLDWTERLIWAQVCQERGVSNLEDIGYGKGYTFCLNNWREFLDSVSALRSEKGMTIVLIAHSKIERFENPETDPYDRYVPRLHKHASHLIQEWCDEVFFAAFRVFTKTVDTGFNRKRTQGIGTGERVIRTSERPTHVAKSRLSLPDELPLDWAEYAKFLQNSEKGI